MVETVGLAIIRANGTTLQRFVARVQKKNVRATLVTGVADARGTGALWQQLRYRPGQGRFP